MFIKTAFADGESTVPLNNPLGADTVGGLITRLVGQLQIIAIPIVALMVLVGAFQMLFSAGDETRFKMGRKTVIYSIIGYAILLLVGGIADLIQNLLGV